jgi:hypothetical protein
MRVSRIQAAENRQTEIDVASRLFRERGFDGIGLKGMDEGRRADPRRLLQAVRVKEALAAQVSKRALESAFSRWSDAAATKRSPWRGNGVLMEHQHITPMAPSTRSVFASSCPC